MKPVYLSNTIIENNSIEDESLTFTSQQHLILGPNLSLKRCQVILKTNQSSLLFRGVEFVECEIIAKKRLSNFQLWSKATIIGCQFKGHFSGNDFGGREDPSYVVKECDFSHATLSGCRFFSCVPESLKFTIWPCYAVINPNEVGERLIVRGAEGNLLRWAERLASDPSYPQVLVDHWPSLYRYLPIEEGELRTLLSEVEGVLI